MLTVKQAAELRGVKPAWIHTLIRTGRLKATKFGRDWMIDPADLAALSVRSKPGRPRKIKTE